MLFFDQFKKNDPQLRLLAVLLSVGLLILLGGLWWVQVVSAQTYQNHLEVQSYRSIRMSAVRGRILDCTGTNVLAENRPRFNLCLNWDALRGQFDSAFIQAHKQAQAVQKERLASAEKSLGRSLTKAERKKYVINTQQTEWLREQARMQVATGVVADVSRRMGEPIVVDPLKLQRAYATRLAMPYPILADLTPDQIARFEEHFTNGLGADLDLQSERYYPLGTTAAHVLGYVRRDDSSEEGEESFFSYRLPDYGGISGVEGRYNDILRGTAGMESVLVNNLGYRQSETVWSQPEPGHSIVLTIDLDLQRAAEAALLEHQGANARGAAVVMDVRTGDILAMASSPTFNPDYSQNDPAHMADLILKPESNRAMQENLAPGSIFKTVVAIAALENGLNPNEVYLVQANPEDPEKGCIFVGRRKIRDTAPPGEYDFKKAFIHSSNSYFVNYGLRAGVENIVRVGREFHLGERTGLFPGHETGGNFPTMAGVQDGDWRDGDTANLCIGQGDISVTPLQMTVLVAAIANGGYVLLPRLVQRVEPLEPGTGQGVTNYPGSQVRNRVIVHQRTLNILRDAMRADVADKNGGTGTAAAVPGLNICGKTGTAQVQDGANHLVGFNFWFSSYAPYENPRYAVVVMVQSTGKGSGGTICAPIAHDIYAAIVKKETPPPLRVLAARD